MTDRQVIQRDIVNVHTDIAPRWPMTSILADKTKQLCYFEIHGVNQMHYGTLICKPAQYDDLFKSLTEKRTKKDINSRQYSVLMRSVGDEEWEVIATIHSPALASIIIKNIKDVYQDQFEISVEEMK